MDVSLTPELEQFIQAEISSGHYRDPSHLVRAALTRLQLDKPRLPELPATREELEQQILESIGRMECGEYMDGEESRRLMFEQIREATSRG
jgi:antitoxin ParD1/3/4